MLNFIDNLDSKKPKYNKLCMLPGFNIIDSTTTSLLKGPVKYSNEAEYKNSFMLDKDTISEKMFFKLYGLIDTTKKQLIKKTHKKKQRKLTRKQ